MIGKRIAALALSIALTAGMAPSAALATTSRDVTATGLETASAQLTTQATTNCVEGKYVFSKADDADNYEVIIWDDGENIAINPASMTLSATAYIPFSAYALTQGTDGGMSLDASINIASWNEAEGVRTWYDMCFKKADSTMRDGGSIDWWYHDDSLQDVTEEKPAFATFEKVGDFIKVTYTDVPVDVNRGIQMGSFNTKTDEFNEGTATLSDISAADYSYAIRFRLDGWEISDSGDFYITEIKLNSGSATYTKDLSGTNAVGELIYGDDEGTDLYPTTFDPEANDDLPANLDDEGYKVYADGETGWSLLYVDGKDATLTPEIELYYEGDGQKTLVDPSKYTVSYERAWWDDEAGEEKSEATQPPFAITDDAGMGDEVRITATAVEGSGLEGTTQPTTICPYDKYTLAGYAAHVAFGDISNDASEEGQEKHPHMWHDYYQIPFGTTVDPSVYVESTASLSGKLLDGQYYDVAYYDWTQDSGWDRLESAKLDGAPTQVGQYYVAITGKDPYYGSVAVDFDITEANLAEASIASIATQTYTGAALTPAPTVKFNGTTLTKGTDYTVAYKNNTNVGTATVTITGKGNFTGTKRATFKINKAAQPLTVKAKTATVKYANVKKKAQTLAVGKVLTVSKKQGTVSYVKKSGNKNITINKKTGKVTVKKGLKKGTYKVKVRVTSAGNANYKSGYKDVTFTVKVS